MLLDLHRGVEASREAGGGNLWRKVVGIALNPTNSLPEVIG